MSRILKRSYFIVMSLAAVLCSCASGGDTTTTVEPLQPIEESYEYSVKSGWYLWPDLVDKWVGRDALATTTEDGTFFCFTADTAEADDFINAQRTLLRFLGDRGVEAGALTYYATDYGDSFSESDKSEAYIALSALRSYRQVLVTLQALWGDYTDYGYVYAMSNAIAKALEWQTDPIPSIEEQSLDTFFSANHAAINLLYPTFTTEYADEETVNSCKALSTKLFEEIDWYVALPKSIDTQLDDYYVLVSDYAKSLSVDFTRQSCGYAYYSEHVPLRMMTAYVELLVDKGFSDRFNIYGEYFSEYGSIYETVNVINEEISAAVEYFGLEDEAGVISMQWLSGDNATEKFGEGFIGRYYVVNETAYLTSIKAYMHEYHHHLEYLMVSGVGSGWQSQAFCELGGARSQYTRYYIEYIFTQKERMAELFKLCTGHVYQAGINDFYEANDIYSFMSLDDGFELNYYKGADLQNSMCGYLVNTYGERTAYDILLFPDTVTDIIGKTWDEIEAEWEQHIRDKYADVQLPDWVNQ